jgi:hypothetical protein
LLLVGKPVKESLIQVIRLDHNRIRGSHHDR